MKHFSKKLLIILFLLVLVLLAVALYVYFRTPKIITLGLDAELTGGIQQVGKSSLNAANLAIADMNRAGGITVGGRKYLFKLQVADNQANVDVTKKVTQQLIDKNVLAIVGPNASKYAVVAAEVAEANKTLLISPWSTNPLTTVGSNGNAKQYVFRAAFIDPFQGQVLASFAINDLHANTAAILYDSSADVLTGQADYFQKTFEKDGGKIVQRQSVTSKDTDYTQQLQKIQAAKPDVIFLPVYYAEAANIIIQARKMGIKTPFLGSDAWGSQSIVALCGSACEGSYMVAHFSENSTDPTTQKFVKEYQQVYGVLPDDVAALTYDSFGLLFEAIKNISGSVDRQNIVTAMGTISQYHGITGEMTFSKGSGDPVKSAVIMRIRNGSLIWFANENPK